MFGFGKKTVLIAPQSGKAIPITDVPDPVFAEKILGDGIAIEPSDGLVVSPCDGTVVQVASTNHSVAITSDDGLDILVHLGIDTVDLKGEGFKCFVKEGQKVKAGDKVLEMDLDLVRSKGLPTISPCIITNMDALKDCSFHTGPVTRGDSPVCTYKKA